MIGASILVVEGLSLILWAFGTWTIPLLVVFGLWRHVRHRARLTYTPELWAIVFPLGMYTTATAEFGAVTRQARSPPSPGLCTGRRWAPGSWSSRRFWRRWQGRWRVRVGTVVGLG